MRRGCVAGRPRHFMQALSDVEVSFEAIVTGTKNPQVVDLLAGSKTSRDVPERPEIIVWWSWGESNPRPKAIAGQIYTLS